MNSARLCSADSLGGNGQYNAGGRTGRRMRWGVRIASDRWRSTGMSNFLSPERLDEAKLTSSGKKL